jgi:hypothetical protein
MPNWELLNSLISESLVLSDDAFCVLLCTHWYLESLVVESVSAGGSRLNRGGGTCHTTLTFIATIP